MKKFLYLIGALALLATASCKDDDAPQAPVITNSFSFNGQTYAIDTAKAVYWGEAVYWGDSYTHAKQSFYFTDGVFEEGSSGNVLNGTYRLYFSLYSPGTDRFRTGTFPYNSYGHGEHGLGKYYMVEAMLVRDGNNDGKINEEDEFADMPGTAFVVFDGSVILSGEQPNYTLFFDLKLANSHDETRKALKGNFSRKLLFDDYSPTE